MEGKKPNKKYIIRKIPLRSFMDLLNQFYQKGANYVDLETIITENNFESDKIGVIVPDSYIDDDFKEKQKEMEQQIMEKNAEEITINDLEEIIKFI